MTHPLDEQPKLRARWLALGAGMLAQCVVSALQHGLPALGPVLRQEFGLSLAELGALLAAASWGMMLTVYPWGRLADAWSERGVVAVGSAGAAAALVWAATTDTAVQLGLAIGLAGAMSGSAISASGRAVMGWFPFSERGLALGLRQMAVPLGAGLAAVVLPPVAIVHGVQAAFLALAVLAAAGVATALAGLAPPPWSRSASPRTGAVAPMRDPAIWRVSGASGLMHWAQVGLNSFMVVILVERQMIDYATAALLFATVQALSGAARVLAGWMSDRRGRRVPHLRRYAVGIALSLLLAGALQSGQSLPAIVALILATVLAASWNGLAFASVAELAGHARAGSALGLHGTIMRAMTIPTGLAIGYVASRWGWSAALFVLALLPAASAYMLTAAIGEEERRAAAHARRS